MQRIYQHKTNFFGGFTKKYNVKQLVYYEVHDEIEQAIASEKRIKRWHRKWKLELIEKMNPQWNDLYDEL